LQHGRQGDYGTTIVLFLCAPRQFCASGKPLPYGRGSVASEAPPEKAAAVSAQVPTLVALLRDQHRQECLCYKKCPHESGHSRLESPLHETYSAANESAAMKGTNQAQI
jgi:hypothetical protein